ncbi:MAG: hypothetical protein ACRECJ_08225 [Limisphaerales bacterium]
MDSVLFFLMRKGNSGIGQYALFRRIPQEICIYYGEIATSRDHVPPKLLLEQPFPSNLKTVSCCLKCNQGFSFDEQYFLILLGQIGTSSTIKAKVSSGGVIDRTLSRAPALDRRLFESLEIDEDGRIVIHPEYERINRVIKKIAIGLFALRYGRVPASNVVGPVGAYPYNIEDQRPLPFFIATFTERFRSKQWQDTQPKVFSHIFVRDPQSSSKVWCVMDFHQTLWGVVHLPNPKSVKTKSDRQLWLFSPMPTNPRR